MSRWIFAWCVSAWHWLGRCPFVVPRMPMTRLFDWIDSESQGRGELWPLKSMAATQRTKMHSRIKVVNEADGTWSLFTEDKKVSGGPSSIDPSKTPKTIDFTPSEGGGQGNRYLGIYELGENTRKMCFSPPGKPRPTEFKSAVGSDIILVRFERDEP